MENMSMPLAMQLRERIKEETANYIKAIDDGQAPNEAREIIRRINILQKELDKLLLPQQKDGNGD